MAATLVENMAALTLDAAPEEVAACSRGDLVTVKFKVSGMDMFEVEMDPTTAIRDVKKLAKEGCNIQPEHMRLIYKDRVLKDAETLSGLELREDEPIRVMFTAGHTAFQGGGKPPARPGANPFSPPVRGIPGSKGARPRPTSSSIIITAGGATVIITAMCPACPGDWGAWASSASTES
uniref:Ubiquitin-like domain-containing protein n=1 Tax=Alexandrium monilatum TaxID=311494 RepID=A0A7S4WEM4_9DINO